MRTGPTPRQLARVENIARIKALALEQLATGGAADLSLRAIARELNIVSSAIYRYYPCRDDLITELIVDAYHDLAGRLETVSAGTARRSPRRRWLANGAAMRDWARAEPHRFALIYGSAIPGYRAPADTIPPAGRVINAFFAPLVGIELRTDLAAREATSRALTGQLRAMGHTLDLVMAPATLLAGTGAFARVIGLLTLELNGHLVGGFEPADDLFATLLAQEAAQFAW